MRYLGGGRRKYTPIYIFNTILYVRESTVMGTSIDLSMSMYVRLSLLCGRELSLRTMQ